MTYDKTYGFVAIPTVDTDENYLYLNYDNEWKGTKYLVDAAIYPIVSDLHSDLKKTDIEYEVKPVKIQVID
jgi:hypothetical protein